jgi:peptide/nickel transport system substrate-binding protein
VSGWPLALVLGPGIVVLAALWVTFGGSLTGSDSGGPDRYVEAVIGSPSRVNPLFAYLNDSDRDLVSLVFSGLTRLSADGQVLPDLAESWEISGDGRTVTFHLRPGVTFHTGSPFTSADVVFTYNLLADPNLQGDPEQAALWRQVHCSAPDELTVACELPAPFAPFTAYATIGILPRQILEGVDAAGLAEHDFNRSPVGTGPYRLAQLSDTRATLRSHASYHLGAPLISELELQFYPDAPGAVTAVLRGDADAILVDSSVGQPELDELNGLDGLKTYSANRTAYTALYLNNGKPPLNDPAVRSAVAQAVDVDSIVSDVLGGLAARATSPVVPGTWAFNPDVAPYEHDSGDARDTLDNAGWLLPEGGEVRIRNDLELRLSLMTDQDPVRAALAERIREALEDIGIAVTIVPEESANLVRDFLIPREYQAAIFGWDQGLDPDPYPAWHSSQAAGNGRNLADYRNEEADSLMEEARRSSDIDRRQSLYYTFQEIFHADVPSLILYYPVYNYLVRDNVEGIELGTLFTTGSRFRNVHEWALEETARVGGE